MDPLGDLAKRTTAGMWNHERFTILKQIPLEQGHCTSHHCLLAIASGTWSNGFSKRISERVTPSMKLHMALHRQNLAKAKRSFFLDRVLTMVSFVVFLLATCSLLAAS